MADEDPDGPDDGGWVRRASRRIFESNWFRLRQDEITLPGGDDITYTVIEHPGWVLVVPVLDDGRVVMEEVYRHPLQRTLLECPSGGRDGEPAEQAARRELEEETGYVGGRWTHLGRFATTSGISNEEFDAFLCEGPEKTGEIRRENTEQMEVVLFSMDELVERARRGHLPDAPSALSLLLAAAHLERRDAGD